ncbi:MAG: UDP-2,3-diacylglucosamine diphosphatase [Candidatus Kapaibacteriales bacterium]
MLAFFDLIKNSQNPTLYLLGDIFDYWFEYKTVVPARFYRTLNKIGELVDSGVEIHYLMGNHDFGHKDFFKREFGIEINPGDIELKIEGKRFFLAHGDGKMKGDTGYKILKKILRSPISNTLFRLLHPDLGIGLASGSSNKSRAHTDAKEYGHGEGIKEFAIEKLSEGYDYAIMGHRHKFNYSEHNGGTYINLGEWLSGNPKAAIYADGKMDIADINDMIKNTNS